MLSRETLHDLVCETAALLGLARITSWEGRDAWSLVLGEGQAFDIEHDADDDRVIFSVAIGCVAEPARARIHELLLAYNHLRSETGGAQMALDWPDQQVVMTRGIPAFALSAQRMRAVLEEMAVVQGAWREVLRLGAEGESPRACERPGAGPSGRAAA